MNNVAKVFNMTGANSAGAAQSAVNAHNLASDAHEKKFAGKQDLIESLPEKNVLADADTLPLTDSEEQNAGKRISWANIKAMLGKLYVPMTRRINNRALSADVTLTGDDIKTSATDETSISAALSNKAVKSYGILKDQPDLLAWAKRQDGSGAFNIHPDWTTEGVPMKAWYSGFLEKSNDGAYKLTLTIADNGRTFVNVTYAGAWVGWRELAPATPPQEYDMPLDSGWTTVPSSHCVYSKDQFGMVRITLAAMPDEPVSENTRIAVLPAGFRPAVTVYRFPVVSTTGTVGFGYITGSGELGVWPFGPMKEVSGSFQYIVKD